MAADGLATVKGFPAKVSITGWVLLGGLVIAIVATFLPFATVTVSLFRITVHSHEVSANGTARFVVYLLAAAAVGLAWPVLSGSRVEVGRLIGLSVVAFLLGTLMVVYFLDVSKNNSKGEGIVKVSPAIGLLLYAAGVLVIAAGVVWLWIHRSRTQKRAQ